MEEENKNEETKEYNNKSKNSANEKNPENQVIN